MSPAPPPRPPQGGGGPPKPPGPGGPARPPSAPPSGAPRPAGPGPAKPPSAPPSAKGPAPAPARPPAKAAPAKPAPKPAAPPPPPPKPNPVARAGKFFEVRKGSSGEKREAEEEDESPVEIALPRSITQEAEEADLKRRLNREELVDIDDRHAGVKLTGTAAEPTRTAKKSAGFALLAVVAVVMVLIFLNETKFHWVNFGSPPAPKGEDKK